MKRSFGQRPMDLEMFMEKVSAEPNSGCWLWTGWTGEDGYGLVGFQRKWQRAHRVILRLTGRELPEGLVVDHLCRNRCCVNPQHLELVTQTENKLRGFGIGAINKRKTHCKHGHALTPDNWRNGCTENSRACRTCHRLQSAEAVKRNRLKQGKEAA